jgi:glycosyltransferase involved in cell wall biosynthesis
MTVTKGPFRILMSACVPQRREGGVATIAYNLGDELQKRGHAVKYLFEEDLMSKNELGQRFAALTFSKRLSQYIGTHRKEFSIVNLHAPAGVVYGIRRRWLEGYSYPPYVMTLHGLEERRIHVQSREHRKGRAWNFALGNRLWHRSYWMPLYGLAIRSADGAHTYSRDVWNLLQLKYNLDSETTAYIPNGVAERFFLQRRYDIGGPLKLLYVGTWLDQRGIFYIRDALKSLAARLPGLTMTFAGCGCPAETIRDFFGQMLAPTIVVHPTVPAGDIHQLFAAHDVFLFPSLMEGLPSVLLELWPPECRLLPRKPAVCRILSRTASMGY